MKEHKAGDFRFLSYVSFDAFPNVTNVVTTRVGGRSTGRYASLNLSFRSGDEADTVLENRAVVSQSLGIEPEALTCPEQVHGSVVAVVTEGDRGKGAITEDDAISGVDSLVTNVRGLPLMVLVADCVALSLYDPANGAVGLAHAGWKGTLGRVAERTVAAMADAFGTRAADLFAGISPSIGRGHYEVGQEVFDAFVSEFGRGKANRFLPEDMDGTFYLDLWGMNEHQLVTAGLDPEQITIAEMCTACHPNLFYSHRHEGGDTGRIAGLIMIHASGSRSY